MHKKRNVRKPRTTYIPTYIGSAHATSYKLAKQIRQLRQNNICRQRIQRQATYLRFRIQKLDEEGNYNLAVKLTQQLKELQRYAYANIAPRR